jgi:hypothetical protein
VAIDVFRAADSAGAVAFVVGCGGAAFRVALGRAERIALQRGSETLYIPDQLGVGLPPPAFNVVRAMCPDQAIVGSAPSAGINTPSSLDSGWFFSLSGVGDQLEFSDYEPNRATPHSGAFIGTPIAIVGPREAPIAVFRGGVASSVYAFGDPKRRTFFGAEVLSSAAFSGTGALITATSGRVGRVAPAP